MKKRVLALLLCVSTAISMTGCGSKGESVEATEAVENTESTEEVPAVPLAQYDLKGSDYVTLCDYSAIPVTISGDYDVTDQDVLCLLYTSPSPRDGLLSRMPSSA